MLVVYVLLLLMRIILRIVTAVVKVRRWCKTSVVNHTKWRHVWWRCEHVTLPYQVTFQRLPFQLSNILLLNQPLIILLLLCQLPLQNPWPYFSVIHYIPAIRIEPTIDLFVIVNELLFLDVGFFLLFVLFLLIVGWFLFAD